MIIDFYRVVARVLTFLVLGLFVACGTKGVSVYVAQDGSDENDGTKAKPFSTIEKARDALRGMATDEPKNIIIREGKYYDVSVTFTAEEAGLTVAAERGENAILYGGRPVKGWEKDGEDFYAADVQGVNERKWDFRSLVVNDGYRLRARYPKTGALEHENEFRVRWMSTTGGGWERPPTGEELTTMQYRNGDIGTWFEAKNAEITVYHQWDESLVGVRSVDAKRRIIRFSTPAGHPPGAFYHSPKAKTYVIWNIREGMTKPGQWYLDRVRGKLVYWPLPGENMETAAVIAPTTERIFTLEEGADNITLEGLTLQVSTTPLVAGGFGATEFDGAITGSKVSGCVLRSLTVKNVGGWGIKLNGTGNRIENSEITGTGAGGIGCGGGKCVITNNHIHAIGVTYPSAIALTAGGGEPIIISHNEIHNTPYSAITCGGDGHLIEYNKIYDMMRELYDGGGIYIGGGRGIILRGNVIRGEGGEKYRQLAYYLDENADSCVVENNLALNTGWPSQNHMTRNCIIRNNVFIDSGRQLFSGARSSGTTFEKNILVAEEIVFQHPVGREVLPKDGETIPDILKKYMKADGITSMPNNVIFSRKNKITHNKLLDYATFESAPLESRDGSVFADPLFVDMEGGDYDFMPESPARKLGIEPIDVRGAGLLKK